MPKRRDAIRMSEAEIWDLIGAQKNLQVATINKDGSVQLTTLWFAIVDGAIVFETFTKSQKIVNLRRDPRIAVLVEDGDSYDQLRGVSINGRAELVDEPAQVERYAEAIVAKNNPEVPPEMRADAAKMMARKRTVVIVRPERIASWDHRKLGGTY
ncbi:MAG: TIGR03618 family F420-dependent PPOX class oxidoreductase [Deltaproteobacteria bacterium]|nr:TIGR03618 family F420-dependent PPOX class oxidoreductase [Deltaproteobacteria bacterium]